MVDRDGSNFLTYDEFIVTCVQPFMLTQRQTIYNMFKCLGPTKDNTIKACRIKRILNKYSDEEIADVNWCRALQKDGKFCICVG